MQVVLVPTDVIFYELNRSIVLGARESEVQRGAFPLNFNKQTNTRSALVFVQKKISGLSCISDIHVYKSMFICLRVACNENNS